MQPCILPHHHPQFCRVTRFKIHEVDTAALSTTEKGERKKVCACDTRLFLLSVQSRFPPTAHMNTLLQCRGSGTAVAALRITSSLAQFQRHHGHVAGFASQLEHVLAVGRLFKLYGQPLRHTILLLAMKLEQRIRVDSSNLRDSNPPASRNALYIKHQSWPEFYT